MVTECPVEGIVECRSPATFAAVKLALVGNPNTGKSTVFQRLTGRSVSVGNLAGVTVDTAVAPCKHKGGESWTLHDLPGIYNLHAQSDDGRVTERTLLDPRHAHRPDVVMLVADASTLQGQLFLILQVRELGVPCMLLLNDMHTTGPSRSELRKQARELERDLDMPVRVINALDDDPADWVKAWAPLARRPQGLCRHPCRARLHGGRRPRPAAAFALQHARTAVPFASDAKRPRVALRGRATGVDRRARNHGQPCGDAA